MNQSLKKIFVTTKNNFVQWVINPKFFILFSVLFFFYSYITKPLLKVSSDVDIRINLLEPFISLCNSGVVLLILPILFLVLISDFPYLKDNTIFFIVRIGRLNWLMSQFLQLLLMSFTFLIFIFVGVSVPLIGECDVNSEWSGIITTYIYDSPEKRNSFAYELLPENLYNQLSITSAFVHTFALMFLYLVLIGMVFILLRVINQSKFSSFVSGTIIILGTILGAFKSKSMWFFPMAHTTVKLHYTRFLRKAIVPLAYSYMYYVVLIIVLALITIVINKKARHIY